MSRIALPIFAALLIAGTAYASQAPDSAASVLKDCSADNLPPDTVDACLERARVLDESSPTPALQSLEVKLSQMEAKRPPRSLSNNAPPPPQEDIQEVIPPDAPADRAKALDTSSPDGKVDENGRDTSDDDINPADGPPTDAEMHPYSQTAPTGGSN
jgi:hypothetical protein